MLDPPRPPLLPFPRRLFRACAPLLLLLALAAPAAAKPHLRIAPGTNDLVMPEDAIIEGESAWLSAGAIDMAGTTTRGDTWILAYGQRPFTFTNTARAAQDLRFAAQAATLDGTVDGNAAGFLYNAFHLTPRAKIGGDLFIGANTVICEGAIRGETLIFARSVTLGGSYGGRVRVQANELRIAPGTVFSGDLLYVCPTPPAIDKTVKIAGKAEQRPFLLSIFAPAPDHNTRDARLQTAGRAFFGALLTALFFLWLFPGFAGLATWNIRTMPWRVLWTGVAALFCFPALSLLAFFFIGGIPLALLLAGFYTALLYLSRIIFSLWLGGTLMLALHKKVRAFPAVALGLFLWHLTSAFPLLSGFLHTATLLFGMGAMTLALFLRPHLPRPAPRPAPRTPTHPHHPTPAP